LEKFNYSNVAGSWLSLTLRDTTSSYKVRRKIKPFHSLVHLLGTLSPPSFDTKPLLQLLKRNRRHFISPWRSAVF